MPAASAEISYAHICSQFRKTTLCAIACLAYCFVVETVAQPIESASPTRLTTPAERAEFCARMRDAATPAQRQAVAQKWHEMMVSRATEQGVDMSPGMHHHQPMMGSDNGMHMRMDLNCGHTIAGAGRSNSPDAAVLHITQYRGIAYVTGGVGEDEAVAMRGVAPRYSMRARFTTSAGNSSPMCTYACRTPPGNWSSRPTLMVRISTHRSHQDGTGSAQR